MTFPSHMSTNELQAVLLSLVNIQSNTHTGVRIVSTNHGSCCAYYTYTYTLDKLNFTGSFSIQQTIL